MTELNENLFVSANAIKRKIKWRMIIHMYVKFLTILHSKPHVDPLQVLCMRLSCDTTAVNGKTYFVSFDAKESARQRHVASSCQLNV
ncbi:unnamed protein product [Ceratitis capitata]|uniref:(Mediterranean fruit fly) hypothetical protein n=1 Tax=Ceratitis capitata TaxID=7213 RepID=A0A811VFP5_CERCA|nr:unnamed protein product [Ceratitis capitata]